MAMSRAIGARSVRSWPWIGMRPSLTSSSPAIMRSVVDLPQPDSPSNTTNSPLATANSNCCTTVTSPKRLTTF